MLSQTFLEFLDLAQELESALELSDQLRASTLFVEATAAELAALSVITAKRDFSRGARIFDEGETADGFYIVVSGRVKVYKLSPDGREQILHILGTGEAVGEAAVFAGSRFPAHAEAIDAVRLLFLPREPFIRVLRKHPTLALGMLAALSRRLKQFTHLIEALSLKEAPGRFASYLMLLCGRDATRVTVSLGMAKRQLAALLGLTPESLSRVFTRLVKEGIIAADGARGVRIEDIDRLARLASGEERLV